MRKSIEIAAVFFVLIAMLFSADSAEARKKKVRVTPYKAQVTFSFSNEEGRPVHGLRVTLNGKVTALTDPQSGFAGPFRDIRGNGTSSLKLLNPAAPISPSAGPGDEVTVTFRSDKKKKLRVTKWWWTDKKGKPVGGKKSGKAK